MQQNRHDPYPWTWEPIVAAAMAIGLILVLGVHLGRAAACLISGTGWCWTSRDALFTSMWPILTGNASAGLTAPVHIEGATLTASVLVAEVGLTLLVLISLAWALRRWGPAALKGVASPSEVEQLLGRQRLYRARRIVRPDLYGKQPHQDHFEEAQDATV